MMGRSVPEGWLEYKPYGDVIKDTKILPFKVPLKKAIVQNLKPEERFTVSMILQAYPRLKFIVDLTNTGRYYDKTEFTSAGVKHIKIMIPGKKVPPPNCVIKFFETMDNFMAIAADDDIIGVHCTHGINRTGYLICRYLIEKQGWESENSLQAFSEARGYSIYRDEYITVLKKISPGEKKNSNRAILPRPVNTRKENNSIPISKVIDQYKLRVQYPKGRPMPYSMGPQPGFKPHRRGFTNRSPYLPQPFGFGAPPHGFGSMPPHPPGMPPPPPVPPMYGPRPLRFGPPLPPPPPPAMRAPMPLPPGPDFRRSVVNSGFHPPGYPNRLPGPSRMSGPPRLPPGPQSRLPPPKMPPPPPPPPPQVRQVSVKRLSANKKKHHNQHQQQQIRNGMAVLPRSLMRLTRREVCTTRRVRNIATKMVKEQDFTVDTFEENLLAVNSTNSHLRRSTKGRYHQTK